MNRSALIATVLAAVFVVVLVVALVAQPIHYRRTAALALVLAVASAGYAVTRRRAA